MLKTLRTAFIVSFIATLSCSIVFSQCDTDIELVSVDPPIPPSGSYDPGTTVELCFEVTYSAGADWISAIVFDLPDGWDVSDFATNPPPPPPTCGGGAEWIWFDSNPCGCTLPVDGPGWYYDSGVTGPLDGDPCNDWGAVCLTGSSDNFTYCIEIELDADCGGPGNPFDGQPLAPTVTLYGDQEVGSWSGGPCDNVGAPCPSPTVTTDLPVTLNCCDAEPGVPPADPVDICGTTPFNLTTLLGPPIDPNGTWTGPTGWTLTAGQPIFDPLNDPPGDYVYEVTGSDGCISTSTITMQYIELGLQAVVGVCDATPEPLLDLFNSNNMNLNPPAGGTWTDPSGNVVPGGILDPTTAMSGDYVYEYTDASGCITFLTMQVTIALGGGGTAAPPAFIDVCTLAPPFQPADSLTNGGVPGGQWIYFDENDMFLAAWVTEFDFTFDPLDYNGGGLDAVDGYFVYFNTTPPCPVVTDTIFMDVYTPFNAGDFTEATVCADDAPLLLETLMIGGADSGGNWEDINGNPVPNPFDPSTVIPDSTYTFFYSGSLEGSQCFDSQLLLLTIQSINATAGTDASITVCESDPPFDMLPIIGGTDGGEWEDPNGDPVASGFFVPGNNIPGDYVYTINTPCTFSQATLTVDVTNTADAGIDGTLAICANDVGVPLIGGLGGTPDTPGDWELNGNPVGPTVDGATVNDGDVYIYTTGSGACQASSQVTIDLTPAPFAGTATTVPQQYCETDPAFLLSSLLTTPPSNPGFWTGPGGYTGDNFDPSSPLTVTGTYTHTVTNACGNDTETIFIEIEEVPNAGTSTALTVCPNSTTAIDLSQTLGGGLTPGGTWTGPSGAASGIFNIGDPAGDYTYEVFSQPNNLCSATATVTVSYSAVGDAGLNASVTVCENDPPFDLIDELNGMPDGNGTWTPSGTPAGVFTPGVTGAGTFVYTITNPGCPPSVATLTVNVDNEPDAGVPTTTAVCQSLGSIDLTSYLNGNPLTGGDWVDLNSGNPISNPYDVSGLCGNTLSLQYTVSQGVCSASSTLQLEVQCPVEAGIDVTETYCADNSALNLNNILDPSADPGGEFTNNSTGNVVTNGVIVLSPGSGGSYTYTVDGDQCPDDQATYTINLDDPISVDDIQAVCTPSQTEYVVTLVLSGGDGNYNVTGGTMISANTFESDPIAVGNTYTFTIDDGGPCPPITIGPTPGPNCACPADAEFVGGNVTICEGETADLELNFPSGTGPFDIEYEEGSTPVSDGPFVSGDVIQVSPTTTTTYTLTSVTDQNCTTAITDAIVVIVEELPEAGPDLSFEFCGTGGVFSLGNIVDAGADPNGTFINPSGNPVPNPPNTIPQNSGSSGVYTYEVTGTQCPADQASYDLTFYDPLNVTVSSVVCTPSQNDYIVTLEVSGGNGNYTINNLPGTVISTNPFIYESDEIDAANPYSYTVSDDGPCADVSAGPIAPPNCSCPATATFVDAPSITICEGECADLELSLSGAGPFTISYNEGANPVPNQGPFVDGDVINVCPAQTTTYSLTEVSDQNCTTSASSSVTVVVEEAPNAGPDVTEELCGGGPAINLFNFVDGTVADTDGDFEDDTGADVTTIPSSSASSGIYTYIVEGNVCPADEATYNISISDPIQISNVSVVCNQAQTGYTVSFNIEDGDGNYSVSEAGGITGTITGSNPAIFESDLIPNDTDYNFTISDDSPCADETVSGIDPDCDCPASASISGTTDICDGQCADITFSLQGDGPFDVVYTNSSDPGNPETLNDISDGHIVTVCPDATSTYTVTSVNDVNCDGVINGQPVTITVDPPFSIGTVTTTCDANNETYTVSFPISGGIPNTYQVTAINGTPFGGTVNNGVFTSAAIPSGDDYTFSVQDGGACDPQIIEGTFTCPCETDAGSMTGGLIEVCEGSPFEIPFNEDEFLDGNDGYQFLLHDGDENNVGSVFATSANSPFPFPDEIEFGVTYYLTGVAGNTDFFGNVILTDICTDFTDGVPVVFYELPTATISGSDQVCPGEVVDVQISLTGDGPWDFVYAVDSEEEPGIFTDDNEYTISTTQPGQYTLTEVSDNNCVGTVSGVVEVSNYAIPTAEITGDGQVCEGSGDGPVIQFTGQAPYTFTYSLDDFEFADSVNSNSSSYTLPVDEEGSYELVTMSDANCDGTVSGEVDVTILEAPTAMITGGGTVCEGDEAAFEVELTGAAPWSIVYEIGGVAQDPINTSDNSYTFTSGIDGDYVIAEVSDQNCSGEVIMSQAQLIVNQLPTAEILSNEDQLCIGQELELIYDLQGNPPFDLTYVLGEDTVVLNDIGTDYIVNLEPNEPVFTQVLYVEDSSNPVCVNTPNNSKFIPVGELPNAPVLQDDTICAGSGPIEIGVEAVNGLNYSWEPEANLSDPGKATTEFTPDEIVPVLQRYTYVLTANNGDCYAEDTITITVDPGPRARFQYNPNPVNSVDTKVRFTNNSIVNGDAMYFWEFDSLGTSSEENPIFEFPEGVIANYVVSLLTIDPLTGCTDEITELIEIKPEMLVFVPNAFTPDGDGLNDLWGPTLSNVDENDYVLTVYNRFGEVVFTTRDVNQKWNGSMRGDNYYVKTGVYVWQIETKNLISLEDIDFKGTVTVIR